MVNRFGEMTVASPIRLDRSGEESGWSEIDRDGSRGRLQAVRPARSTHLLAPRLPGQASMAACKGVCSKTNRFRRATPHRNFAYDYEAYGEITRNLSRLVDAGHVRPAMKLCLELMRKGS